MLLLLCGGLDSIFPLPTLLSSSIFAACGISVGRISSSPLLRRENHTVQDIWACGVAHSVSVSLDLAVEHRTVLACSLVQIGLGAFIVLCAFPALSTQASGHLGPLIVVLQ